MTPSRAQPPHKSFPHNGKMFRDFSTQWKKCFHTVENFWRSRSGRPMNTEWNPPCAGLVPDDMKPPAMKILVVEDEVRLLRNLAKALREEGYAVDTATDGEEGLYKAENSDYDAIVLDIMLPRLDGWQVLERLRRTQKTPVLFLTARDTTGDRVRGLDGGADDYLVKPFDLSELFARLRAVIRRSANRPSPEIRIGPVVLDTRARTVAVNGQPVTLTAKEYMILEYLAQNQGKVISRTELYEHVFDERADNLSNLLDVHIFNIRKKLACEFIATRRGHGYCVE